MSFIDDLNNRAAQQVALTGQTHSWDDFYRQQQQAATLKALQDKNTKANAPKGNFLTNLIPTGGGIGGALAGGAAGAALGSVVPVVGTAVGGLLGAILGGAGGSALGKVGENAVEGNKNLGQGVGEEALLGGLTSTPIGAGAKVVGAGIKLATGIGKAGAKELVEKAGQAAIPKLATSLQAKAGQQIADTAAAKAASGGTTLINPSIRSYIADKGAQMEARAGGFGIGEKASGSNPLGFYDSAKIGQNLDAAGIKAGSPERRLKQVEDTLNTTGGQIDNTIGANNISLTPADRSQISTDFLKSIENQPGVSDAVRKSADNLAKNFNSQTSDVKSLIDFRRGLDKQVIAYNRNPDSKLAADQLAARTFRDTISQKTSELAPGISDLNNSYHDLSQAKEYLTGGAKAVSDQSQNAGGSIAGRLLTNDTAQGVKSVLGSKLKRLGGDTGATKLLPSKTKVPGQGIAGAIARESLLGARPGLTSSANQTPVDANGLTQDDIASLQNNPIFDQATLNTLSGNTTPTDTSATDTTSAADNPFGVSLEDVAAQLKQAIATGDTKGYSTLSDLYDKINAYQTANSAVAKPLSAQSAETVANANSGLDSLSQLAQLIQTSGVPKATIIPGRSALGGALGNALGTSNYDTVARNIQDVITRLRSGAAITPDEAAFYNSQLPQAFDSPETIQTKLAVFQNLFSRVADRTGSSGTDLQSSLTGS